MNSMDMARQSERKEPYIRKTATLLTVERDAFASFSFDREACLVRGAWKEQMVRWGLDGSALLKTLSAPGKVEKREKLNSEAGLALAAAFYERAAEMLVGMAVPDDWQSVRERVISSGPAAMNKRAADFHRIYAPVGILPPDQYGALVLQLTTGCRYNRCSFCTFYRGQKYMVKSPEAFAEHIRQVKAMLGAALERRQAIFLGDAGALNVPRYILLEAMDLLAEHFPLPTAVARPRWPVYAFMDAFGVGPAALTEADVGTNAAALTTADFAMLREMGLSRVYIGVESGSEAVLRMLNKPVRPQVVAALVKTLKEAGIAVGVIFLLGVGGQKLAAQHAEESAALLAELPLDGQDTVFFSELVADEKSSYSDWVRRLVITPLTPEELAEQERAMRRTLPPREAGGPAVTRYDVREFIYY